MSLLDHRFVVVLGKGGVGRTTITGALGHAAARRGKTACVAELGAIGALPESLGLTGTSFAFRSVAPQVDAWSLTVPECLEEFGARKLHLPGFARRVVRNRFVSTFVDAIPGLRDLILLGKIENLIREPRPGDPIYDTVFLDAPATGHGLTLLQSARTMTEVSRAGPFHDLAAIIGTFLADAALTAVVLVTLPEALPIQETLELSAQLIEDGFPPAQVIVNRTEPPVLPPEPSPEAVRGILDPLPHGAALRTLAEQAWARQARQDEALEALRQGLARLGIGPPLLAPAVGDDEPARVGATLAEVLP